MSVRFPATKEDTNLGRQLGEVLGELLKPGQERAAEAIESVAGQMGAAEAERAAAGKALAGLTAQMAAAVKELRRVRSFKVSVERDGRDRITVMRIVEER
jgi:hypothetical protein